MNNRDRHSLPGSHSTDSLIIRFATAGDRLAIERLAELDSAPAPRGAALIGELSQGPVVAVSVTDGNAVADPFVATADVLELVRMRAEQLSARANSRPLERALSRVRGRVGKGRARSSAASRPEPTPAAPAA